MSDLQLLIIDEISMVGSDMLLQIHNRLCEITGKNKPFGNISILALGDFFQLSPVGQKFVFEEPSDILARFHGNLWKDNFKLCKLTKIVRQEKDNRFGETLHRIRLGKHTDCDMELLRSRSISKNCNDYPHNSLHVFATNAQVLNHNLHKLQSLGKPIILIPAIDKKPAVLKDYTPVDDARYTGGLPRVLELAINAKVMVTRNLNVEGM